MMYVLLNYLLGNSMELDYSNSSIKEYFSDLCDIANSKKLLQKKIGLILTKAAKKRIDHLKVAATFQKYLDFHIGNPHSLTGDLSSYYGVDLDSHTRLIIQPIPPDLSSEALKLCEKVKIIGIVDYHGDKNEWLIA